jgi:predicted DNA-binding mobile mystery protein A
MKSQKAEFRELQRSQLDAKLADPGLRALRPPRSGWIRAIRSALGMSAAQLGRRLNMTRQGVTDLEKREAAQTVSLASLRKVADALECDLVMALVPRDSLENAVRQRARRKALEERNRLVHTMRLERQESGVEEILDIDKSIASWLTARRHQLWD